MIVNQEMIKKPWGHEVIWSHCEKFVGKILCINYKNNLSRQYHKIKEETIMVLTGTLLLEIGSAPNIEKITLYRGQSFHIIPGLVHRFCAEYGDVELVEVSSPEINDVVRLEDDYNRTE